MKVIARYITKEVTAAFLAILGVLFLIVLSNRLSVYLSKAAMGELPISLVLDMVLYFTPELLSYLIPLAFYLSLLFTLGKLYSDNEMIVMNACGVSAKQILGWVLISAGVWAVVTAGLTLWVVPKVSNHREQLLANSGVMVFKDSLVSQQFQSFSDGRVVFYIDKTDQKDGKLVDVFIAEYPKSKGDSSWVLMKAEQATLQMDSVNNSVFLILNEGYRYQGIPGFPQYTVTQFDEYGKSLMMENPAIQNEKQRSEETSQLFQEHTPQSAAELQWRISLPLSLIVLTLIGFPLAKINPRQGRLSRFLPAVLIYIIYYNLFTISRRWVAASVLPAYIGSWWVHVLFLIIGVVWNFQPFKKRILL